MSLIHKNIKNFLYNITPSTLFTGQNVIYLPSCRSTNEYANQLLSAHPMDGTLVVASEQTAGRGQRGNHWEAKPDQNLTFSVIWKPTFLNPAQQFQLNIAVSLGVADFIEMYLPASEVLVKWSNDLYFRAKKLGGILIENQIQSQQINYAVVGIGLNINQTDFQEDKAISFAQITHKTYQLEVALEMLLAKLEARYFQLRHKKYDQLKTMYLQKMYRYQETHWYRDKTGIFRGEIIGIDAAGRLAVSRQHKIQYYNFKEIEFL